VRAFIAVNLPPERRREIADAVAPLLRSDLPVRWVESDAYHVTLKFLGAVADGDVEPVAAALRTLAVRHAPFTLRIGGAGAFPDLRRPAVLWLGVAPAAPLLALQQAVEQGIGPLGFPPEARPFHPHVTLGRTRRDARPGALRSAEALLGDVAYEAIIPIETVDLMSSHTSPRGARYERVLAAPLAA
jgi:2'-5' RNA ligase